MSQFLLLPPTGIVLDSQASPTFALTAFLPVVSLPNQYPALPRWVDELCDRIAPAARRDYALLSVLLFRSFALLVTEEAQFEQVETLLADLSALPEREVQERVLRGLASPEGDQLPEIGEEEALRNLVAGVSLPVGEESIEPDSDRLIALLQNPGGLKRFLIDNLKTLWHEHLRPHWEKNLPVARQQALAARRHFTSEDVLQVFRAVTGRPFPPLMLSDLGRIRRIVFCPVPFYGPYCVCSLNPRSGEMRVGYGVGIQPVVPEAPGTGETTVPGGLLPVLEALADEHRLQILAMIRDRGTGCAQEFIAELGLSQPATSRHMRLLETTGLVQVERIDGIKWYRINPVRVGHVASLINAFLTPPPQPAP